MDWLNHESVEKLLDLRDNKLGVICYLLINILKEILIKLGSTQLKKIEDRLI